MSTRAWSGRARACAGVACVLLLGGCGAGDSTGPPPSDLQVTATAHVTAAGIAATVHFASPSGARREIWTAGVCMPALLVYRDSTSTTPSWDEQRWSNGHAGGCKWLPVMVALPGSVSTPAVSGRDILGDSLPAGTYMTRVRVILARLVGDGSRFTTVIDGILEPAAGTITIAP